MTVKELIKKSKKIIKGRLKLDTFSRLYSSPVFKQKKIKISEDEIRAIQDALYENGIYAHVEESSKKYYLKVVREKSDRLKNRYFLHLFLFFATIYTTTITGAMLLGNDPFAGMQSLASGLPYSLALMSILLFHEMGHYLFSRYYKVEASLPYFIPLYLLVFHPGTLGAFIRMRSPIPHKKALFDIGIAGPLAGFVMSLIFLFIGFDRLPDEAGINQYILQIHPLDDPGGIRMMLGNSILYDGIASLFGGQRLPMSEMYHFPFIFAGWLGLLVTAINLMPIGQLDGGHITYAMFGDRALRVAIAAFAFLIFLNVYLISNFNSYVWILWPVLIFVFIRFRHPPTLDDSIGIDVKRKLLGWIAYIIFVVSFSPMPIYVK